MFFVGGAVAEIRGAPGKISGGVIGCVYIVPGDVRIVILVVVQLYDVPGVVPSACRSDDEQTLNAVVVAEHLVGLGIAFADALLL